jgi:2-C-methyl-D-erythritol 4-phosphate cytidylyltransferase
MHDICTMKPMAIIVAGGSGTRMGSEVPKQFLEVAGAPLLVHSISAFAASVPEMEIVVVLPAAHLESGSDLVARHLPSHTIFFAEGGETRFHSVQRGLQLVREPSIVFVHDAVRCLVSPDLILRCYLQAMEKGSAIPAIAVSDSIRQLTTAGHVPVDRTLLRAIQTPQTFRSDLLIPAFRQPFDLSFTDEASVVERYGGQVELIEGEVSNIKVTWPVDLVVATELLKSRISEI